MPITDLQAIDGFVETKIDSKPCYIHNHHSYLLPIIQHSLDIQLLKKPYTLISFDHHFDGLEPLEIDAIKLLVENGSNIDNTIKLVKDNLSQNHDEWIKAGMELELIKDAVILGVSLENRDIKNLVETYEDLHNNGHSIGLLDHPGRLLDNQGELSDIFKRNKYQAIWDLLNWHPVGINGFTFHSDPLPIILDIDLDSFCIHWEEFIIPFPEEVFDRYYYVPSTYRTTKGWSGKRFFDKLIERAAFISIALEPNCCGGREKSIEVLNRINKMLFDNKLQLPGAYKI